MRAVTDQTPDQPTDDCACPGPSRRTLFRGLAAAGVATALHGTAFTQTAFAATRRAPQVLVVLSMRGAADGMSLVVPHADPVYYAARPRIAVPAGRLLVKDQFFGLHPHLSALVPMWNEGRIAAVHATGMPVPNRSHFEAMEIVEDADPGSSARVGWLNRLLARDSWQHPLQGIALGSGSGPTALHGPHSHSVVPDLGGFTLAGADKWDTGGRRPASMNLMWARTPGPLGAGARAALGAVKDFAPALRQGTTPAHGARYPDGDLGSALAAAARTIRGDVGAEVITVDHGDWDHHAGLGTLEWGTLQQMTTELGRALAAFFTDLGTLAEKVTLVTISEFGRRTRENANTGLDHGHGNVMFVMGAGVKGGYHGTWPGLANTVDDDLRVTTDYRQVLAEVISRRFGASPAAVFPGVAYRPVGCMR